MSGSCFFDTDCSVSASSTSSPSAGTGETRTHGGSHRSRMEGMYFHCQGHLEVFSPKAAKDLQFTDMVEGKHLGNFNDVAAHSWTHGPNDKKNVHELQLRVRAHLPGVRLVSSQYLTNDAKRDGDSSARLLGWPSWPRASASPSPGWSAGRSPVDWRSSVGRHACLLALVCLASLILPCSFSCSNSSWCASRPTSGRGVQPAPA